MGGESRVGKGRRRRGAAEFASPGSSSHLSPRSTRLDVLLLLLVDVLFLAVAADLLVAASSPSCSPAPLRRLAQRPSPRHALMLPKVANHLLHHTARAISVAQNQTGQTIRNVLQLQSSSSPSTASGNFGGWNGASSSHSNWNGRGTGSGGAKFHPGGRTYPGYTVRPLPSSISFSAHHAFFSFSQGAGRAVTQAEAVSVDDLTQSFNDDSDDVSLGFPRSPRGNDLSSSSPSRSRSGLTVLRSVRAQATSHRPFGPPTALEASSGSGISTQATALLLHRLSAREVSARLHSTTASAETVSDYLDVESPASPPSLQPPDAPFTRSPSPASSLPTPPADPEERTSAQEAVVFQALRDATESKDTATVNKLVEDIISHSDRSSVQLYNAALDSLSAVRPPHQSLRSIVTLYNDMITRSVAPNFRTYTILIRAFTDRDQEIHAHVKQLERRIRRQKLFGGDTQTEEQTVTALHAEDNLRPALLLFQTASAIPHTKIVPSIHHRLLESCAFHKNVDAAVHVYAHFERCAHATPSARTYELLMNVYMAVADWSAVKAVFAEFRDACQSGRISRLVESDDWERRMRYGRICVWSTMIESYVRSGQPTAALGLLEQMLDTKAGDAYNLADVPPPSVTTFNRLIVSFCESGEIDTALAWFNRLLLQDDGPRHPFDASTSPCRPDYSTWIALIEALYMHGRVDDLLKVMASFEQFSVQDQLVLPFDEVHGLLQAYIHYLASSDPDQATAILDGISALISRCGALILTFRIQPDARYPIAGLRSYDGRHEIGVALSHLLLTVGRPSDAIRFASLYVDYRSKEVPQMQEEKPEKTLARLRLLDDFLVSFCMRCRDDASLSMQDAVDVCELAGRTRQTPPPSFYAWCLHKYADIRATVSEPPALSFSAWQTLFRAVAKVNSPVPVEALMEDYARTGAPLTDVPKAVRAHMYQRLLEQNGEKHAQEVMGRYTSDMEDIFSSTSVKDTPTQNVSVDVPLLDDFIHEHSPVRVDRVHNSFVAQFTPLVRNGISSSAAYERFEAGRAKGLYPRPEIIAQLISALGREHELEKVRHLYTAAQLVLQTFENNKEYQSHAWFLVEDHMIIALAHGGEVNAAHVHRARIIEHGGVPSADAYGALIHNVKDTTDDAHNAIALFHEARDRGVTPNIFLYNTMISKLAKARKADDALSLFYEMKASGIRPSSVTYGAVIAACCRVGDVASAETLFAEMSAQPGFRPRVPPYNTMMQLYTTTRPDRARALHYFDAMIAAGIQPSAHTYKVSRASYLCV